MPVRFIAGILLVIIVIGLPTWAIIHLMQRHRFQFSLRTLLIVVTALAVLLSLITSWNYLFKAQIEWLDPSSTLVVQWKKPPEIVEENGQFKVTYRPQHRGIGEILISLGNAFSNYSSYGVKQTLSMESDNRRELGEKLAMLSKSDILQNGCFTIQGIVKDADGKPVRDATIYLMGSSFGFTDSYSREDGTFFMPIKTPAQAGYFFKIFYRGKKRYTPTFLLDSSKPELFVVVRVK
jgi:hypothetical protein